MFQKLLPSISFIPINSGISPLAGTQPTQNPCPVHPSTSKKYFSGGNTFLRAATLGILAIAPKVVGHTRSSSIALGPPEEMLSAYRGNQGTIFAPPNQVKLALYDNNGQITPEKMEAVLKKYDPIVVFYTMNLASHCSDFIDEDEDEDKDTDPIPECLETRRLCSPDEGRAQCLSQFPPSREQAEYINIARLAIMKMVWPYLEGGAVFAKNKHPLIVLSNTGLLAQTDTQGVTNSRGRYAYVRVQASLNIEDMFAVICHELMHASCHHNFEMALRNTAEPEVINEILTERMAKKWTGKFADLVRKKTNDYGGEDFAEVVIKLLSLDSGEHARGSYDDGLELLTKAYHSAETGVVQKILEAVKQAEEWVKAGGDMAEVSRTLGKHLSDTGNNIDENDIRDEL